MSSKPKRTGKVKVARIRVRSLKRSLNHYKKFKRLLELLSKNKLKNVSCDYVTRMKYWNKYFLELQTLLDQQRSQPSISLLSTHGRWPRRCGKSATSRQSICPSQPSTLPRAWSQSQNGSCPGWQLRNACWAARWTRAPPVRVLGHRVAALGVTFSVQVDFYRRGERGELVQTWYKKFTSQ